MTRYRVKSSEGIDDMSSVDYRAKELKEEFGLHHDLHTIDRLWSEHSSNMAAGWLTPSKEEVEQVFNVTLEVEVEDEDWDS